MLIISVSGARGIVGDGLSPDVIARLSSAFGSMIEGRVVLGMNTRASGLMVKNAVISGLMATGLDVIDMGIIPTPTVLYNVKKLRTGGGISRSTYHRHPATGDGDTRCALDEQHTPGPPCRRSTVWDQFLSMWPAWEQIESAYHLCGES